jgi:hypothetical protein
MSASSRDGDWIRANDLHFATYLATSLDAEMKEETHGGNVKCKWLEKLAKGTTCEAWESLKDNNNIDTKRIRLSSCEMDGTTNRDYRRTFVMTVMTHHVP